MSTKRIVVIDGHIIAQYYEAATGWWTCVLPGNKFAIWKDTRQSRFEARSRFGRVPLVECDKKPSAPHGTRFYDLELRRLAMEA